MKGVNLATSATALLEVPRWGVALKVSMGGMVGPKKLSEPEKMLVRYEDAFERANA